MTDRAAADVTSNTYTPLRNDDHITEAQEMTPLLRTSERRIRWSEKIWLVCLGVILIVGVSIGTYLLCVEGQSDIPEKFYLVLREEWATQPTGLNVTRLSLPSRRVLLMQTDSRRCWSTAECIRELRDVLRKHMEQLDEPDILYNFVVAGDGRVYEGRGWDYRSSYVDADEEILIVAFLGTYNEFPPTDGQIEGLKAFLDYAVMKNNLIPCYNILVRNSPSRYLLDIAFDIQENVESDWC